MSAPDPYDPVDDYEDYATAEWRALGERLDALALPGETRVETLIRVLHLFPLAFPLAHSLQPTPSP